MNAELQRLTQLQQGFEPAVRQLAWQAIDDDRADIFWLGVPQAEHPVTEGHTGRCQPVRELGKRQHSRRGCRCWCAFRPLALLHIFFVFLCCADQSNASQRVRRLATPLWLVRSTDTGEDSLRQGCMNGSLGQQAVRIQGDEFLLAQTTCMQAHLSQLAYEFPCTCREQHAHLVKGLFLRTLGVLSATPGPRDLLYALTRGVRDIICKRGRDHEVEVPLQQGTFTRKLLKQLLMRPG